MIFTEECDVYGKACFIEVFTKGLDMGLPLECWVEKTVYGMEILPPPQKKVPSAAVIKGHVDSSLNLRWGCLHLTYHKYPWESYETHYSSACYG